MGLGIGGAIANAIETMFGSKTDFHEDGGFTARDKGGSRTYDSGGNLREETVRDVLGGTATYDAEGNLVNYQDR
jgi:hypothetical protein